MIKPRPNFIQSLGFTMIELLIVISILGFLAVAVLAAINPIEQINRGKDTGSRSDAEQLLSAMDRFYSSNGHYIWQENVNDDQTATGAGGASADAGAGVAVEFDDETNPTDGGTPNCTWVEKLTTAVTPGCPGANEVKTSFTDRIIDSATYNTLLVFNDGNQGDSTYLCFVPKSKQFRDEAEARCEDATGTGLPTDLQRIAGTICGGFGTGGVVYSCLP